MGEARRRRERRKEGGELGIEGRRGHPSTFGLQLWLWPAVNSFIKDKSRAGEIGADGEPVKTQLGLQALEQPAVLVHRDVGDRVRRVRGGEKPEEHREDLCITRLVENAELFPPLFEVRTPSLLTATRCPGSRARQNPEDSQSLKPSWAWRA